MKTPVNTFKAALKNKEAQIGLWLGLADSYSTEICAGAGFDWLLVDGEHSPAEPRAVLQQLQAIAAYPASHPICRIPMGHGNVGQMIIKQYLDLGVSTLLVPMVDTPEQAQKIVQASRYPQNDDVDSPTRGYRGMAGVRASRFGRLANYGHEAMRKFACWFRQSRNWHWTTWKPLLRLTVWTASSLARPICRRPSATC